MARLVSDRILAERGLPPPIMAEPATASTSSVATLAQSLKEGVARTQTFLAGRVAGPEEALRDQLLQHGKSLPTLDGPDKIVRVQGMPYAQGPAGLVYDAAGRPYRADDQGTLQPMSQMEFYLDARRLAMQPDPDQAIKDFSRTTRDAFARLAAKGDDAPIGARPPIGDDQPMIRGDNRFEVALKPGSHQDLVKLFDPKVLKPDSLFKSIGRMSADSTLATTAMSRYDQQDLEMWHMQKAMERCGDAEGAKGMSQNRESLFGMAKDFLKANPSQDPPKVEALKLQTSPLRFGSLAEAQKHTDDDKMTLWRGDLATDKYVGVQADSVPLRADAKDDAHRRDAHDGTASLMQQLDRLSGSSKGTGMISFTSDPTLLADESFASTPNMNWVPISSLPKPIQALVNARLPQPGATLEIDKLSDLVGAAVGTHRVIPPGSIDIGTDSQFDANLLKNVDSAVDPDHRQAVKDRITNCRQQSDGGHQGFFSHAAPSTVVNIGDLVKNSYGVSMLESTSASQRAILTLRREDNDQVKVTSFRRALVVEVNKADCIPGISALGGGFEMEQEVHVDHKQAPTAIIREYPSSALAPDQPKPAGPDGMGAVLGPAAAK